MDPEEYISESEIESDGEEVESSKPTLPLSNNRSVDDLENELDDEEDVVDLEDNEDFDDVDEDEGMDNDDEDLDNELQTTNDVRNQNIRNFDLSDDDDDESDDENYLQKFEDNMKENIIE